MVIAFKLINLLHILPSLLLCRCLLIRTYVLKNAEQLTSLIVLLICYLLKLGNHPNSVRNTVQRKEATLRLLFFKYN